MPPGQQDPQPGRETVPVVLDEVCGAASLWRVPRDHPELNLRAGDYITFSDQLRPTGVIRHFGPEERERFDRLFGQQVREQLARERPPGD